MTRDGTTRRPDTRSQPFPRPRFEVDPPGPDFLDLPAVRLPAPARLVVHDPRPPITGRYCGRNGCDGVIGAAIGDRPPLTEGFCPKCRTPFSFAPQLSRGDLLDGHYAVEGCLAYGGLGWVYLARDTRLENHWVALKGLIHSADDREINEFAEERRYLTVLDHPGIVGIISYLRHRRDDGAEAGRFTRFTGYIVMEFVGGISLRDMVHLIKDGHEQFTGPRLFEHIVAYGCGILEALGYLHDRGLVYCDMKPHNVIHHDDRVKVIDLGGVRRVGDTHGRAVHTPRYAAPEVLTAGVAALSVRSDLHTVGRTLEQLSDAGRASAPPGLALESYDRVIARATAADPRWRFGSAREMAEQLRGVGREMWSLREGKENPEPSRLFAPTAALLDAGLGRVPPLERWLALRGHSDVAADRTPLDHGLPPPDRVAPGLPVPVPDPADSGALLLNTPTGSDPRRLAQQLLAFEPESVEVRLRLCRLHMELGDPAEAEHWWRMARRKLGEQAPYDWRLTWHRGLLLLTAGQVARAEAEFDHVYTALPGEYAPKLALGYCAEHRGDPDGAEPYYQAVWQRNRSQGSGAFGLARIRLARRDRQGAVDVLSRVPKVSRHHDAAQIAAVRVLAGRLTPGRDGLPSARDYVEVIRRLRDDVYLDEGRPVGDARDRLVAEIREVAVDWAATTREPHGVAGDLLGRSPTEGGLRGLLEESLRSLARQAGSQEHHDHLVDLANATRPVSRL
jgi:serine/threonine-protein kinase PknG